MTRPALRHWPARCALWAMVCALLLKAAVPMLASASAGLQGKTLVEVCTVYGLATVALDAADGAPAPADHATSHGADHCVLTGLLALDAAPAHTPAWPSVQHAQAPPPSVASAVVAHDAAAAWAARLQHGPPRSA